MQYLFRFHTILLPPFYWLSKGLMMNLQMHFPLSQSSPPEKPILEEEGRRDRWSWVKWKIASFPCRTNKLKTDQSESRTGIEIIPSSSSTALKAGAEIFLRITIIITMVVLKIGLLFIFFIAFWNLSFSFCLRQASLWWGSISIQPSRRAIWRGADDPIVMSQKLYHSRFRRFFYLGSNSRSPGCRVESLPQETIGGNQETSHPPISH